MRIISQILDLRSLPAEVRCQFVGHRELLSQTEVRIYSHAREVLHGVER
jgi:hypothetical protein